ncbi:MAG: hypothetical protein WCG87_05770 [Bacteroidota bacterium]
MTIGIVGCGWLGERIAASICDEYSIRVTTTSQKKIELLDAKGFNPTVVSFSDDFNMPAPLLWREAQDLDVVIITVPFPNKNASFISQSAIIANLSSFLGDFKGQMFFMSSTSVYPDVSREFTEDDLPLEEVGAERLVRSAYPQVNILRLAGLMGGNRLLSNYRVSNLELPVNHVHYVDVCGVVKKMIELHATSRLYNVVAPMHPSKAEVIGAQKNESYPGNISSLGRIISCQKLVSELNYQFRYPDPRLFHM